MSNLKNIQRKISEGVSGWLLFEFHCFRGYLFNEKYLSYPIGQILNGLTKYNTITEINHPCGTKSQGRPLQIDFILLNKKGKWKYAFESKWVGNSKISLGSILWDLIRLQNLFSHHPKVTCYFVIAGFDKKLNILFENFDICYDENSKKQNEFVEINNTFLRFDITKLNHSNKTIINNKLSKYPNFSLYSKIECRPAHRHPKSDTNNMTFSTYTFEILPPILTTKIIKL